MHKLSYLLSIILLLVAGPLQAQMVYVNAATGSDAADGKVATPVATLQRAVELAKAFKPGESVTIKVAPGLYTLRDQVVIDKRNTEEAWLTIEAASMPDDTDWKPSLMPVIQSISGTTAKRSSSTQSGFW